MAGLMRHIAVTKASAVYGAFLAFFWALALRRTPRDLARAEPFDGIDLWSSATQNDGLVDFG